jgi:hypothetical protein
MAQGYRASRIMNLNKEYWGKRYPGYPLCPTKVKNFAKWKTRKYERRREAELIREELEQFNPEEDY